MNENRLLLGLGVAILLAAVVGCLDFEEQTARLEHDKKNDRLILIFNYSGIYRGKGKADAMAQLKEAIEKKSVAFCGNWPFVFQLKTLRADLKAGTGSAKDVPPELHKNLLTLLERVRVRNGGFYTDPAGRVCGAQVVTIEKIKDSMRLINATVNAAVLAALADEETLSAWQTLVLERVQKNHVWVRLKGNSLIVSVPLPEDKLLEGREGFIEELFGKEAKEPDDALRMLRQFLACPVFVWHEDDVLRIKWGLQSKPSVLVLKPREGKYTPNLKEHIAQAYGFHLDDNLARYLLKPDAPAKTEAEQAARMMAPRLTKVERVRVLVRRLKKNPTEQCWARLRKEPLEGGIGSAAFSRAELLSLWEEWAKKQVRAPEEHDEVLEEEDWEGIADDLP